MFLITVTGRPRLCGDDVTAMMNGLSCISLPLIFFFV